MAPGSIDSVMSGKKYNRSVRAWKIMMEAMERLRFQSFIQSKPGVVRSFTEFFESMASAFPNDHFMDFVDSQQMLDVYNQYSAYVIERCENDLVFSFWSSFIEMVQLLLLFLCGTRANDWDLHLSAIRSMLPWFFAYDRVNYQRYLSAYWLEMNLLDFTHPG